MARYAGLDVSLEETALCVLDGSSRIMREARAASEPGVASPARLRRDPSSTGRRASPLPTGGVLSCMDAVRGRASYGL